MRKDETMARTDVLRKLMPLAMGLALSLGLTACASSGGSPTANGASSEVSDTSSATSEVDYSEAYERALSGKEAVSTFIGEPFYDGTIADEEDALAAINSVMERIGGDETVELEAVSIRPTEDGPTYYTFCQKAGNVRVNGASVKLVVDESGKAVGLVSTILPRVGVESMESWAVTQEQAEAIVSEACEADGISAKVVAGATEQAVIPFEDTDERCQYAWVVYTNNPSNEVDVAYLAHYVGADGEYLYRIPVSEPGNADALAGDAAAFAFDGMEEGTWTGTVTTFKGASKEITVPTLRNPETGAVYLADGKRKILCADYAAFAYNETITPRIEEDGRFADNELLIYDTFIRVWDFYDSIGWTGPDGEGTPSLILMDLVNEDGEVIHNAYHKGRSWGFQVFEFNRDEPDGECTDIVGHEFTHAVTNATVTNILYMNDYGAIAEGMSDILGNLIEMMIDDTPAGSWLISENGVDGAIRSMSDPHAYDQPAFTWDVYYVPGVDEPTETNDNGGVHIDSSLLSIISYKLDQAGMQPEEQFFFWMNVALAITPQTDFPQLAELLPWCLAQSGYGQYSDALNAAIADVRLATHELPAKPPAGTGIVKFTEPDVSAARNGVVCVTFIPVADDEDGSIPTWPAAETALVATAVPAGDYYVMSSYYDEGEEERAFAYSADGWAPIDSDTQSLGKANVVSVADGEVVELSTKGLG